MNRFFGKKKVHVRPAWLILIALVAIVLAPATAWSNEEKTPLPWMKEAAALAAQQSAMERIDPERHEDHYWEYKVFPVIDLPQEPNPYGYDYSEGIAISPRGNIYLAMNNSGDVYKLDRYGTLTHIADLVANLDDAYLLGLQVDAQESLYVVIVAWNDASMNGIWRIRESGEIEHLMWCPPEHWPNNITFDEAGNLFMTDPRLGSIWRLDKDGSSGMWLQDPILLGDVFGANGINYRNHSLWVLNSDRGRIVRIPINRDDSPGQPETFVESPLLYGADGGAFDVRSNMYIGVNYQGTLVRVSPRGKIDILVTQEEFNGFTLVTNPMFGFGRNCSMLYITGMNPHVVKVDVGVPGMPLPQFRHGHRPDDKPDKSQDSSAKSR